MSKVRTIAGGDRMVTGRSHFAAITLGGVALLCILLFALEKIGVPSFYGALLLCGILLVVLVQNSLQAASNHPADWLYGGRCVAAPVSGMAIAASLLGAPIMMSLTALFLTDDLTGPVFFIGPLLGVSLAAILLAGKANLGRAATLGGLIHTRLDSQVLRAMVMLVVAAGCILLLWAQIRAGILLSGLYLGVGQALPAFFIAAMVGVAVIPGGLYGVTRANTFLYLLIAAAFLIPLAWLLASVRAFPVPQLGAGRLYFQSVEAIESQLDALGIEPITTGMETGWPHIAQAGNAVLFGLFLAAGFFAMPLLACAFQAMQGPRVARRGAGWSVACLAVVMSAAPAAAVVAKLGIYDSLIGVTSAEINETARWIFDWSTRDAPLAPGSPLFTLCGNVAADVAGAIRACGGNPDYPIGPADIRFNGELATYALAQIQNLPTGLGALAAAGLFAALLSTANAAAFVLSASLTEDLRAISGRVRPPEVLRLFLLRLTVILAIAAAAWLALTSSLSPVQLTLWAVAICGACLAPLLVLTLWWRRMTVAGAIAGLVASVAILSEYPLFVLNNAGLGDEVARLSLVGLFGMSELPVAVRAGVAATVASFALGVLVSLILSRRAEEEPAATPEPPSAADADLLP